MAKIKISEVEPKENELEAIKIAEKNIDVKAIEKGNKTKTKTTKAKTTKSTTTRKRTTTKKAKEEIEK